MLTPGQKLLGQILQSELLIGYCSEITEPVNVFSIQPISNLKT